MFMKALVKTAAGLRCLDRPVPGLRGPRDVRVRVSRAAICRTDVFAARGIIPVADGRILGHEFAGVVESTGSGVTRCAPGQRVVVNPLLSCGRCRECLAQRPHECAAGEFLGLHADGAFAEFVVVSESRVFLVSDAVSDTLAAYAEPLAATMAVLDAGLPSGEPVAVTGAGRIAELTRLILEDHGYPVVRPAILTEHESCFDTVVETDLCPANAEATLRMLRPGGLLVLKSRVPAPVGLPPLLCVPRRLRVHSVYYAEFARALRWLEQRWPLLERFVGSEWALEDCGQAFAAADADEALKIFFKPGA